MKITAFDPVYGTLRSIGGTTLVTSDGSNSGFGGDVLGTPGNLSVVGLRSRVSLSSNMGDSTVGTVLTTVQSSPWVAQFATPSNTASIGSNAMTRTTGGQSTVTTIAASGAAQTLMIGGANTFDITLTANCTLAFTGQAAAGIESNVLLILRQDGTGSRTVTWPGSVTWASGTAPTLATAASAVDFIVLETVDGGTTWFGFPTGGGSSLTIKDEGVALSTAATALDFVGAGVTASGTGATKTITITGSTSPLTTKGDLWAYSTADARFAVGSNGTGIIADSSATFGMRWTLNPIPGEILISSTHSTPLVFDDMLTNSTGDDFVYSSL